MSKELWSFDAPHNGPRTDINLKPVIEKHTIKSASNGVLGGLMLVIIIFALSMSITKNPIQLQASVLDTETCDETVDDTLARLRSEDVPDYVCGEGEEDNCIPWFVWESERYTGRIREFGALHKDEAIY